MVNKTLISYETQPDSHDTGHLRVNVIEFETNTYSQVNVSDGAATLIINDFGKILLVQSVRPVVGELSWELPRGGIISGETPAEAAARELLEETGFVVAPNHLLPLGFMNPDNGILNSKIHMFLHKTSKLPHSTALLTDLVEVKAINWVHKVRVIDAIRTNGITDSATIATLGKARLLGII